VEVPDMPQISLPELKLSELGDRLQEAADESRLPEEVRERIDDAAEMLADAGKDISEAASRLGSEVGERLADVKWPTLALPAALAALTEMKAPKVDLSGVDARDLRKALAKLDLPEVTVGRRSSGPPIVPIVLLAAVGGVFVGWWIATSTYTSARVKSAVQQVRARMGMADDWDENVEERTEDFWSNERGWETNQDPGGAALGGEAASGGTAADVLNEVTGGTYPAASGSAHATGGKGYDSDANR
jgi:hypothetical protein